MKHFLIAIIIFLTLAGCGSNDKKDEQEEQNKKRNLFISELQKDYKIKTEDDIKKFRYTVQFTGAFIDSSNLFVVEPFWDIDDFLRKDDKSYIRFSSWSPTIYFSIVCDSNSFANLYNIYEKNKYPEVLLVVKIDKIEKMFLTAEPQYDEDYNYIELDYSSSFVADGHLITYRFIN